MVYSVLIYSFPLTLLAFEWGLRTMLMVDSKGFTGPTLAAAGLSFLVPLLKPKEREVDGHEGFVMISNAESKFMPFLWIFVFIFLFSWTWSCYMSLKFPTSKLGFIDTHLLIGGVVYFISLIFIFIKEKV